MNNKQMAFARVWTKYLPAIRILLKKAVAKEQLLGMNRGDFESAAGIKKSGYRFVVAFNKSKPDGLFSGNEIVQAFISVLLDDPASRALLSENNYTFSFGSKYELEIKATGLQNETVLPGAAEEVAANLDT